MNDAEAQLTPQMAASQEVDRIREIVFGAQMRDYQQQFQNVWRDLERLQHEIDRLNEQLAEQNSDHTRKQQALRKEMRQANDDLRDELRQTAQKLIDEKVDRIVLGDLFVELGNHLKQGGHLAELLSRIVGSEQV